MAVPTLTVQVDQPRGVHGIAVVLDVDFVFEPKGIPAVRKWFHLEGADRGNVRYAALVTIERVGPNVQLAFEDSLEENAPCASPVKPHTHMFHRHGGEFIESFDKRRNTANTSIGIGR